MGKKAKIEEKPLSQSHRDIIGCPVRIEIPLTSLVEARNHIRTIMQALQEADFILTHQIQNPPAPPLRGKLLDHHALMGVKSIIRSAQMTLPTRKRRVKDD